MTVMQSNLVKVLEREENLNSLEDKSVHRDLDCCFSNAANAPHQTHVSSHTHTHITPSLCSFAPQVRTPDRQRETLSNKRKNADQENVVAEHQGACWGLCTALLCAKGSPVWQ